MKRLLERYTPLDLWRSRAQFGHSHCYGVAGTTLRTERRIGKLMLYHQNQESVSLFLSLVLFAYLFFTARFTAIADPASRPGHPAHVARAWQWDSFQPQNPGRIPGNAGHCQSRRKASSGTLDTLFFLPLAL